MDNIHTTFHKLLKKKDKEKLLKQKGITFWLTGLSGSGKTTLAQAVEKKLHTDGYLVTVLDGDNIRNGVNNDLSFTLEDRKENIRRIGEVSKLINNTGVTCINCFISPTKEIRNLAKSIIGFNSYEEVYIKAPLEVCEERDVKGLYQKARKGEIKNFTGIDSVYEEPNENTFVLDTSKNTLEESVLLLYKFIKNKISF